LHKKAVHCLVSNGKLRRHARSAIAADRFAYGRAGAARRFDITYEGVSSTAVVGPKRNGEICTSPVTTPLEAVASASSSAPEPAAIADRGASGDR